MFRYVVLFSLSIAVVFGMECSVFKKDNVIARILDTCPRPLLDSSENSYCCPNLDGEIECCPLSQFLLTGAVLALPLVVPILLVSLISCVVCCLCVCCGCLYKRRNGRIF